jgi:hypothetical protein
VAGLTDENGQDIHRTATETDWLAALQQKPSLWQQPERSKQHNLCGRLIVGSDQLLHLIGYWGPRAYGEKRRGVQLERGAITTPDALGAAERAGR